MIYSVQYMRAIAALIVVVSHSAWKGEQYSSDPLSFFNVGGAGVDLFFIISGFIMCHTVENKQIKILSFIKARIRRIIPIYWVLTTLAFVIKKATCEAYEKRQQIPSSVCLIMYSTIH